LSRRSLLLLNIALVAGGVALLVVAAFAVTGGDDSASERIPVPVGEPGPLRTTVRQHSPVGQFEEAACRERPHAANEPGRWFHPTENFYPPDAQAPTQADLDHLVNNDDAVAVIYRRSASPAAREALQAWAREGIGVVVAPSRSTVAPPLEAYTATGRITCDGIDLDRLTQFTDRHFTRPLRYRPHGEQSGGEPR
jgi:hypothetical protein